LTLNHQVSALLQQFKLYKVTCLDYFYSRLYTEEHIS
jgi:hypothetical protein